MTRFVLLSTMNLSRMRAISHCQSPCIADQWNANYPSYVSIRLIQNSKNDTFGLVSSFFFTSVIAFQSPLLLYLPH